MVVLHLITNQKAHFSKLTRTHTDTHTQKAITPIKHYVQEQERAAIYLCFTTVSVEIEADSARVLPA